METLQVLHIFVLTSILIFFSKNLAKFAINRTVSLSMVIVLILILGLISIFNLPLELMPDISYGNVTIFTDVRGGLPPSDIERLVTKPIEEAMSSISKMRGIFSTSKKNRSVVTVEFEPKTNMNIATMEVREKFMRIKHKLPKEIERPVIAHYEESDAPILIAALTSNSKTPEQLRILVEQNLKEKLARVEGVANVEIGGGRERKILVEMDKEKLAAFNVPVKQIVSVIEKNNLNIQVGDIKDSRSALVLRTLGAFRSIQEIENLAVAINDRREIIRLKNIAEVKDYYLEAESYSRFNSKAAVTIYVQKESLSNTVKVANKVKIVLDKFKKNLDKEIQLVIVSDQSESILSAISSVEMTLIFGAALVILILSLFLSESFATKLVISFLLSALILILLTFYFLGISLEASKWIIIAVIFFISVLAFTYLKDILPSFIVAISIPISTLITFIFLYFEKFSLNIISLSGLVLGIGLLVDNSIVVLENYDRISKSKSDQVDKEKLLKATNEMIPSIVGGTITTIVVFLPFFIMQKQTQILYAGIAFTVIISLLASLFCALTVVPNLAFNINKIKIINKVNFFENFELLFKRKLEKTIFLLKKGVSHFKKIFSYKYLVILSIFFVILLKLILNIDWVLVFYVSLVLSIIFIGLYMFTDYEFYLRYILEHRKSIILIILSLFIFSLYIFIKKIPKDFLASSEQNEFVVYVELASGVKLDISDQIVKEVEKKISEDTEIKPIIKNISSKVEGWSSKIYVTLVPRAQRKLSTSQVIDKLREKLKGIGEKYETFIYFSEPVSGKEIFVEIFGVDYNTLVNIAMEIASYMGKISQFNDVKIRYRPGQPELSVVLDPNKVAYFNLNNREVAETLHAQVRGLRATSFYEKSEEIETVVRLSPQQTKTIDQFKDLFLINDKGMRVPIKQLADFVFGVASSEIWHRNKSRMIQVSANIGSMPLSSAAKVCEKIFEKISFPVEYYTEIGGDYDEMVKSSKSFWQAMVLTVILIFVVLACSFESVIKPIIVMITVLLSVIGAVTAVAITKSTVTLGVSLGMLMLCGIVVNNGIMLIDRIDILKKENSKINTFELLLEACKQRKRPIAMTTLTTVIGLLPMALDKSESSVMWSPLAITVIGGLVTSTILTLFILPCFFMIFVKTENREF